MENASILCYNNCMANDVLYFLALREELKKELVPSRIDKIYQPTAHSILLLCRGTEHNALLIDADPNAPHVTLLDKKPENPVDAPAFCMLLRKKLSGGFLKDVRVFNTDRILLFELESRSELKDRETFYLLAEMTGRYSNVVLTDVKFKIVDALKRVPIGGSNRPVLPGTEYRTLPHNKIRLDETESLNALDWGNDPKEVVNLVSGLSPESAKEILREGAFSSPASVFETFYSMARRSETSPTVVLKNGASAALFPFDYKSAPGEKKYFATLLEATRFFYENRVREASEDDRIRELRKTAKKIAVKFQKKRADYLEKLENKAENEKNRRYGELIYNNIYKAKDNESILDCVDFENNTVVSVPLDPTLSAAKNAEAYFKKYRKGKRAAEVAAEQLKRLDEDEEYLLSVTESLDIVSGSKEIAEAEEELSAIQGKRRKPAPKNNKRPSPSAPLKLSIGGFAVYVGKNNRQNDDVTFRLADRNDLWFHAKGYHGAHVLIKTAGKPVPEAVVRRAAELAAYYSGAKNAPKAEVDYTEKRFVKRNGTAPGLVRYTDFRTIFVEPKP